MYTQKRVIYFRFMQDYCQNCFEEMRAGLFLSSEGMDGMEGGILFLLP